MCASSSPDSPQLFFPKRSASLNADVFWEAGQATDFAAFHIAAQRVWLGDVELAYQFQWFMKMQAEASAGATGFMPWTYPPQFALLLSPLALLPGWAAYLLFMAVTLGAYLATLREIAKIISSLS